MSWLHLYACFTQSATNFDRNQRKYAIVIITILALLPAIVQGNTDLFKEIQYFVNPPAFHIMAF